MSSDPSIQWSKSLEERRLQCGTIYNWRDSYYWRYSSIRPSSCHTIPFFYCELDIGDRGIPMGVAMSIGLAHVGTNQAPSMAVRSVSDPIPWPPFPNNIQEHI
jgi:hypothetical protein